MKKQIQMTSNENKAVALAKRKSQTTKNMMSKTKKQMDLAVDRCEECDEVATVVRLVTQTYFDIKTDKFITENNAKECLCNDCAGLPSYANG